jgi:hypothetical protein
MSRTFCGLVAIWIAGVPSVAGAVLVKFGTVERLHVIQKIQGTEFSLCFKTSVRVVGGGLYIADDGYVLRFDNEPDKFVPLTAEKTKELQTQGALPVPLPAYSIPAIDYVFGYSLWIAIGLVVGWELVRRELRRRRNNHILAILATPHYQEALRITLNVKQGGMVKAIDYLTNVGVARKTAEKELFRILAKVRPIVKDEPIGP